MKVLSYELGVRLQGKNAMKKTFSQLKDCFDPYDPPHFFEGLKVGCQAKEKVCDEGSFMLIQN